MALEEGEGCLFIKSAEETRDVRHQAQGTEKRKGGLCHILEAAEPKPFVFFVQVFHTVHHGRLNTETPADTVYAFMPYIKSKKDLDEVFQGDLAVGDNEIREDGMGMAAGRTYDAHDTDSVTANSSMPEIEDVAPVISMDMAAAPTPTARTGFLFRAESCHKCLEANVRRRIIKKHLAKK